MKEYVEVLEFVNERVLDVEGLQQARCKKTHRAPVFAFPDEK